ncbi:uncharacterized protein EDB91DRAFT_557324 [Suillus paluster]|uniref:uncharacterized protein n=1 Tax=Suillus paluster TaxID=48578 RepID=UPI001B866643|nr:uncharacterized protein EDB91DRAFT_557324 [Suillus paluster]KAG1735624.1 hypothetical protein EDB91DRAFT_557324 [Suillus paluster]
MFRITPLCLVYLRLGCLLHTTTILLLCITPRNPRFCPANSRLIRLVFPAVIPAGFHIAGNDISTGSYIGYEHVDSHVLYQHPDQSIRPYQFTGSLDSNLIFITSTRLRQTINYYS